MQISSKFIVSGVNWVQMMTRLLNAFISII